MHNVRELIRPSKEEWASLPRRRSGVRPTLMAWLLGLLVITVALASGKGWAIEILPWEDSLRPENVLLGALLAVTVVYAAGGWMLGRRSIFALPLLLAIWSVCAVVSGASSAGVWIIGFLLSCALVAKEFGYRLRELTQVRALALRLRDGTEVELGDNALASERRAFRLERWSVLGLAALSIVFWLWFVVDWTAARAIDRPAEGSVYASVPPVFGLLATLLALLFAVRTLWHRWVWQQAQRYVWIQPEGIGPVWAFPREPSYGGLLKGPETDTSGCTCREDTDRRYPDDDSWPSGSLHADDYCPIHGIDALNGLNHDEFRKLARSEWLWAEDSDIPTSEDEPNESLGGLVGFSGHVFGGIQVFRDGSKMDAVSPKERAAEHRTPDEGEMQGWTDPGSIPPSEQGILDTIDLAPVGLAGTAVRYRHGRAWLRTDEP